MALSCFAQESNETILPAAGSQKNGYGNHGPYKGGIQGNQACSTLVPYSDHTGGSINLPSKFSETRSLAG